MKLEPNSFKRALLANQLRVGLWMSLCSPMVAEVICDSGFDWLLLDAEHAPNEMPDLTAQLQVLARGQAAPVVRVPWNDIVLFKRALDIGARNILVPYVQTAEEARLAVAATRYPPKGVRGVATSTRAARFGRVDDYLNTADSDICLIVQAETKMAFDNLEAIAAVEGVDGVFVGPADLAASLGHLGNAHHPEVQAAIKDAASRLAAAGKAAGILATREDDARRYLDWGYSFVAVGIDASLLARASDALAAQFKKPD